jgi:peptidoglycan hydrolase-like protein with peptidoglycan-binding domain
MNAYELRARRPLPTAPRGREARLTVAVVAGTLLALAGGAGVGVTRDSGDDQGTIASPPAALAAPVAAAAPATTVAAATAVAAGMSTDGDLVEAVAEDCVISSERLALTDTGADVSCLQQGLINAGFTSVAVTGTFDTATYGAVEQLQTERHLFVDGIVGRETAMSVGVWPDEQSFVVRTPAPPAGATDSWGMELSSVSSTGADAPPVPADSGSGKRVVYERKGQRVWAVDEDEQVVRSWLVSGSKYGNEAPGVHEVYSRSEWSTAWNGQAKLPLMIRYQKTDIGAIGFHGIPTHVSDGSAYQTEAELGTRLSGGCQRQANPDAAFLWAFAPVGTTVVVL